MENRRGDVAKVGRLVLLLTLLLIAPGCSPNDPRTSAHWRKFSAGGVVSYDPSPPPAPPAEPLPPGQLRGSEAGEAKANERSNESERYHHEVWMQNRPSEVVVTTGPINQSYEPLGPVHADTVGMVNVGTVLSDTLFRGRLGTAVQETPEAQPHQMNEALKAKAIEGYGPRVDAVVNVTYQTHPDGNVFADGLAVHFTQAQQPSPQPARRSTQERLDEIKRLLEKGYITHKEYNQKREDILKEL